MQIWTHATVGFALGRNLFPDDYWKQAAVVAASIISDIHAWVVYFRNKDKENPFENLSRGFLRSQNMTHSLVTWAGLWAIAKVFPLFSPILLPIAIGGFSHALIDYFCHRDEKYRAEDPLSFGPCQGLFMANWQFASTAGGRGGRGKSKGIGDFCHGRKH